MLFYLSAAFLTILMLCIACWPMLRQRSAPAGADDHLYDLTIYKDQLRELEKDVERGAIEPAEADYARAEIGRRILAAEDAVEAGEGTTSHNATPLIIAAIVFVPLATGALYTGLGSPGLPAEPLALRLEEQRRQTAAQTIQGLSVEELVSRAEAQLQNNPDDGRGWEVLAPMYLRLGRPGDARLAFERAIELLGDSAARRSGLGQAYYMLSGGAVSVEAKAAFEAALALDGNEPRARFFLALDKAQTGSVDGAVSDWRAMTEDTVTPPEWKAAAAEGLRRYDAQQVANAPQASAPALDEETMREAESMSAEDRMAMIGSMIEQLDQRLRDEPDDLAGWQRLIRSYSVLGRSEEAQSAVARAMAAFKDNEARRGEIAEFAAALGIEAGEGVQ
jgi:cytochrome c-type biogenesis protein CcmH